MINVIFALFTLIPIIIIAFVIINWYLDSDKNTTAAQDPRVKYETSTKKTIKPDEENKVTNDEEKDEKDTKEEVEKEEEKEQKKKQRKKQKNEARKSKKKKRRESRTNTNTQHLL